MQIVPPASATDLAWLSLRSRLWPDGTESEHLRYMADALARGHCVRLASAPDGSAVGFVEASQRVDYVNGTSTSPVAFWRGYTLSHPRGVKAWRAHSSPKLSAGRRPKVAASWRPIRQSRTSWLMQRIGRLGSRKRSGSSIFVGPCMVPNIPLNPDASPAALARRPLAAG